MRKNNMFSLTITIANETINNLQQLTSELVTSVSVNQQVQLLHLFIKLQAFLYEGFQGGKIMEEAEKSDIELTE